MADFKLSRFKYTWQGEWTYAGRYNPDDIVSYGSKVYVCLVSHTADSDFYNDLNFFNNDTPPLAVPRWELMADGASWLGNWLSDTYYKIGDITKLGGSIYVCTTGHTSATKYIADPNTGELSINPTDPLGEKGFFNTDEENWTLQVTSKDWQIAWQPNTYYKINDVVRYGGRTYSSNQSHQSASSIDAGLETDIASWDIVNIADDWKGDWTIGTKYIVNDIVRYSGNVYRCVVPHKSTTDITLGLDLDLGKWTVLHSSTEYRGTWSELTLYRVNDVVKYGSYLWECIDLHTSGAIFASANFEIYCPGQEYDVVWETLTVYQEGDVVSYGGDVYYAKSTNNAAVPSTSPTAWTLLFQNTRIRGTWYYLTEYKTGDAVRRGGNVYLALQDNVTQTPDILNDGSTTSSEYWDLVIPGIMWRGIWNLGSTYTSGDAVSWGENSYKCVDGHLASATNRPDDDSNGFYWTLLVQGNTYARLKEIGDIRTFGPNSDSTVDYKRLPISQQGTALKSITGEAAWTDLWSSDKVYFVALFGEDVPTAGTSPQSPWRTLRYALENITGYATVFVRTGVYEEVLPLRVPAFVGVVGDELRSTIIKPAGTQIDAVYYNQIIAATEYILEIGRYVITEEPVGSADPLAASYGTTLFGEIPQDFSGAPGGTPGVNILTVLLEQFLGKIRDNAVISLSGSNVITTDPERLAIALQLVNNKEFIKNEIDLYLRDGDLDSSVPEFPARFPTDLDRIIDAIIYDIRYPGNWKISEAAAFFINSSDGDINKIQNMFLLRDGCGLRNMTLSGLEGELGDTLNAYGTRRVSAGAYASLDPGWGVGDISSWVGSKSPYVQNVTTFGTACVGLKIDGDLHGGGNQTIVCNDFTQILSDGIGVWANGTGRSECVSVFTYYNHISYLCTNGGKIRGTNGNSSYGAYGAVSEGYNVAETPIFAEVNNRYYHADVSQVICNPDGEIEKVFFSNAGESYSTGTINITGSGVDANLAIEEIRDGGVYEVRITDPGDSSNAGGGGYVFQANQSQGGTNNTLVLAASETNEAEIYRQMRIFISAGTGTGLYGYVAEYHQDIFTVYVGTESKPQVLITQTSSTGDLLTTSSTTHLAINDAVIFTGTKFGNIQDNTVYYIRTIESATQFTISFTEGPGGIFNLINGNPVDGMTMHVLGWEHIMEGTPIPASIDTTANYTIEPRLTFSSPGFSVTGATLSSSLSWTGVASNGTYFVTVATGSAIAAYSGNGSVWSTASLPASSTWTRVQYVGGIFIAVSSSGIAAKSTTGTSWSAMTMPSADAWSDVTYGNGKWVIVASGGSKVAYSSDAITWSLANINGNMLGTAVNQAQISTAQFQFGSSSLLLDGTGDYISYPTKTEFGFGTGDFTIECWIYRAGSIGTFQIIFDTRAAGATEVALALAINSSNQVYLYVNGSIVIQGTTAVPATTWTHVSISRATGVTRLYVAGGKDGSDYSDTNNYGTSDQLRIGADWSGINGFNGRIDEFRVTKGTGRYTGASLTVSSTPFVYDSGTVLLLHFEGADASTTILNSADDWSAVEYGRGIFVATAANNRSVSYSTNGTTWTGGALTYSLSKLSYGNNRFVALQTGAATDKVAISFDGITWNYGTTAYGTIPTATWSAITYGQGLFFAITTGSAHCAVSNDGLDWTSQALGNTATWCDITFSAITQPGKFLAISGKTTDSNAGRLISTGRTTQARATVVSGRISAINIWEPGSGYSGAPVLLVTDPNNGSEVTTEIRIGNGVIGAPTLINAGTGYSTTTTSAIVSGDGYKDQYQLGSFLVVNGVDRFPGPGDNLAIDGIDDYVYKVLDYELLEGLPGDYTLRLNIAKDLERDETPEHLTEITIRQLYSQVRLTGHDFLDIGLGNFEQTNYPDTLFPISTVLAPEDEIRERGGGRVFYTSTDQDGNFRVGELFAVEQATGTVTLNAQFFQLQGLEELRLGGVTVGGSGVVIREFSTDNTFTADSNNIVSTQRAIKAYIQRRVSGGGADIVTSFLVAGLVKVGPDAITTTSGGPLNFDCQVNFKGGVDGVYLAMTYFAACH